MNEKKFWLSKTFWMNLLVPILAFAVPGAAAWIAANPTLVATIWGVVNIVLRFLTKKEITVR